MSRSAHSSHEQRITGAASIVGGATVLSRVLGYTRDAAVAYVFGAGMQADAFFMAFRISNLLRRLLGEGALTSSFIPIFTEELRLRDKEGIRALISSVFTLFTLVLSVLTVVGMIFSDEIVALLSPGFISEPEKFALTAGLTRAMFPYMVFVGIMAIAMGILNSYRHFTAPAIAPVFFNISIIAAVFLLPSFVPVPVYALAAGVLLGGALQLLVQTPYLKRFGALPRVSFKFRDPAIKKIFLLMGPAAFGVGIYQLNLFVTMWFSSRLPEGAVSYLYYAGRLMELPLGVFGAAISTAALPSLSENAARRDWDGFRSSISFALRIVNFIMFPATAGLIVLGGPIVDVLFLRGEFGHEAALGTTVALLYYALGLVPVSTSRILSSVFYSLKDTATPVYVAFLTFIANTAFCFLLAGPMGHGGLALATTLSSLINMAALLLMLRIRFGRFEGRTVFVSALKSAIASVVMGAAVYLVLSLLKLEGLGAAAKGALLGGAILVGLLAYFGSSRLLGSTEAAFLKGFFLRKVR